ncbi:hypothetical protein EJ08DRAFT_214158 [Tothia fuscella]|uniref:F-box domain-containing protein n=1 Tax=Tothia fuscella TaxID=1048955 RepID=A0A9P4NSH3_9PEZI|nr:hypothetical protein EJ08DRAFT_214158 [Tothia fuscella]
MTDLQTQNTTLQHLNTDVFLQILDFIPPNSLAILCRTSRGLHEICVPRLYQSVDLSCKSRGWDSLLAQQTAFIQRILKGRVLALKVKALRWLFVNWGKGGDYNKQLVLTTATFCQMLQSLNELSFLSLNAQPGPYKRCFRNYVVTTCQSKNKLSKPKPDREWVLPEVLPALNSINLCGRYTNRFHLPILNVLGNHHLTRLSLDNVLWDTLELKRFIQSHWQPRDCPLRELRIKETYLRTEGPQWLWGPSARTFSTWAALINHLKPQEITLELEAAEWITANYSTRHPPPALHGLRPNPEQEQCTLGEACNAILTEVVPTILKLHDDVQLPRRIKFHNVAECVSSSLEEVGIDVVKGFDTDIIDYDLYVRDWAHSNNVEDDVLRKLVG